MPGLACSKFGVRGLGTIAPCYDWRGMERVYITQGSIGTDQLLWVAGLKESEGEQVLNLSVTPDNGGIKSADCECKSDECG